MLGQEVSYALYGAWRLARLDPAGLAFFDRSREGLIRSFRAALFVYPIYLLLLRYDVSDKVWDESGVGRVLVVSTIGYVISWVAFPLAMLQLSRYLDREARWPGFVVVYNWAQIPEWGLQLLAAALAASGVLPEGLSATLLIAVFFACLLYEWYIARVALDVSGTAAVIAVLIDLVLSRLIYRVTDFLY
jgi:hypothetical protein